ncbi:MAG TPA: helix-turn-helix transcriptional regulator [Thermoanaerobaculia bacterium]|nr:helix-turn-helix transcriptional regulator [Thermoanaerobaculia bacterium]
MIRFGGLSIRTVEARLGLSNGTLRRIFSGRIKLKFDLILDILEILEISPRSFFKVAYEIEDPESLTSEELLNHLRKLGLPEATAPPTFQRSEMESVVLETLERLGLMSGGQKRPKKPKT